MYKIGTVLKWSKFRYKKDDNSELKPRWFICLGRSSIFGNPIICYMITTTTQFKYYKHGEKRENHNILKINKGQFAFEEDCLIDIDQDLYTYISDDYIKKCETDIEVKANISDKLFLKGIYNKICKSKFISKMIKLDIYDSFNRDGIEGINKP